MAGGGLKVAFQAGVLQVLLDEARTPGGQPLNFELADGASGGVFNLAMWCQGLTGQQIADNWRRTQPWRGVSLNWRQWLPIPASLFTYDAFRRQVLQRTWKLDWSAITTTKRLATFNMLNVGRQQHEVRTAAEMNEAALIERNNAAIACGQPGEFGRSIEVRWLSAEVPAHYLFSLSRASMEEAVTRGVIWGRRWCRAQGLVVDQADAPTSGGQVSFRERMVGAFAYGEPDPEEGAATGAGTDTELDVRLAVTIADVDQFVRDRRHTGQLVGSIRCDAMGGEQPVTDGVVELLWDRGDPTWKWLTYRLNFRDNDGNDITLFGRKNVIHAAGINDLWSDTTTLYVHLYRGRFEAEHQAAFRHHIGSGVIHVRLGSFLRQLTTFRWTAGQLGE